MVRELVFARTNRWHRRDLERMARGVLALPTSLRPRDSVFEDVAAAAVVDGDAVEDDVVAAAVASEGEIPRGGSALAADAPAEPEPETEPWRKLELALHLHRPFVAPTAWPWSLSPRSSRHGSAPGSAGSSPSPPSSSPSTPTSLPRYLPLRPPVPPTTEYLDTAADYGAAAWDAAELMPHLREITLVLPARRADSPRGFAELLARSMSMDVVVPAKHDMLALGGALGSRYGWRVEPVDCGVRLVGGARQGGRVVRVRCVAPGGGGDADELEVG
jgi:hypothetical protein